MVVKNIKYLGKKAMMGYSQILILIISMFAFSFLIYQSSEENEIDFNKTNVKNPKLNFLKILGLIILNKLRKPILPMVSAQTEILQCCEETNNGNICQEFLQQDIEGNCNGTIFPGLCKEFANCKPGCCYDNDEGICSPNSPQGACEGEWTEDAFCNVPECDLGCCILGNNAKFTTEQRCNKLSESYGLSPYFDASISNELQCILFTEANEEGACVFDSGECIFTTGEDCANRLGDFNKNKFCSESGLNTICDAKDSTGCVENKDGIYWFDSCGNPEDIYQECNYYSSGICGKYRVGKDTKLDVGNYVCRDLSCDVKIYGESVTRQNGESWCIYDGTIGEGKDVVGSRHIKHSCLNGEEVIEPCADFRNEICVQGEIESDGVIFTESACRINRWRECAEINIEEDLEKKAERCEENYDCELKEVTVDDSFTFSVCTPQYSPGLDLKNNPEDAQMVCGQASQQCIVIYVKDLGGWDCEVNCDCEEIGFTQQMNDYCVSVGDCGGYVNILGDEDDAYTVSRAPEIKLNQYKKYADENPNQKPAEPGNYNGGAIQNINNEDYDPENENSRNVGAIAGGVIGGYTLTTVGGQVAAVGLADIISPVKPGASPNTANTAGGQGYGNAIGAGLGAAAGTMVAMKLFGKDLPPKASLVASIAGSVGGAYLGATSSAFGGAAGSGGFGAAFSTFIAAFIWAIIIVAIIIGIMKLFGVGDTKEKIVEFKCLPWQAPTKGLKCDLCDGNPFKPCSEYRCKSLGQACDFINQGTGKEKCVDNSPNDVSSPKISPLYEIISEGYEYSGIQTNGFELLESSTLNCIPEYTTIDYGIQTDKPAQCKIGTSALETYEQMPEYFGASNLYLTNHTSVMFMISPSAFQNQFNLTDEQMESYGEIRFYVRCQSINGVSNSIGYTIKTCVKPGPDLTPPYITNENPLNGAYTAYNQTEQDLEIWVNEPANCKWSIFNQDYSLMNNEFDCQTSINLPSLYGWSCTTKLTNTHIDETFYIKCEDQPFESDNNLRNPMQESYVYNLFKSSSALTISGVEPVKDLEVFSNIEPVTIELTAQTSGGAENGEAECSFGFNENNFIRFLDTYSTSHSQIFSTIVRGNYEISIRCEDFAGNIANAETSFKIIIDTTGPKIVRMYYDGVLKIYTNEEAECRYSFDSSTIWEDKEIMSGTEFEHTADWKLQTYYIQCEDTYGSKGDKEEIKAYNLV